MYCILNLMVFDLGDRQPVLNTWLRLSRPGDFGGYLNHSQPSVLIYKTYSEHRVGIPLTKTDSTSL